MPQQNTQRNVGCFKSRAAGETHPIIQLVYVKGAHRLPRAFAARRMNVGTRVVNIVRTCTYTNECASKSSNFMDNQIKIISIRVY